MGWTCTWSFTTIIITPPCFNNKDSSVVELGCLGNCFPFVETSNCWLKMVLQFGIPTHVLCSIIYHHRLILKKLDPIPFKSTSYIWSLSTAFDLQMMDSVQFSIEDYMRECSNGESVATCQKAKQFYHW